MSAEGQNADRKSLRKVTGATANWSALAGDCVCFANAAGGTLLIGIEDADTEPPATQRIEPELLDQIRRRVAEMTVNVYVAPELVTSANGGQYISLQVAGQLALRRPATGATLFE